MNNNITLVTGIFDLGRSNAGEGFKRPFAHYILKFSELLRSLKDYNIVVYIEEKYKDVVLQNRDLCNTIIRIKEVEDFKASFPFYEQVKNIRNDEKWYNQTGWLKESTQATLDLYNPMVMSKLFMLHDEKLRNPFNTEYFFWIDGGLTNTVHHGYFSKDKVLDKIDKLTNKFLFLAFPYAESQEIHGFDRARMNEISQCKNIEYVCRGGFFGGHHSHISEINGLYYSLLHSTLEEGLMGTEESVFTIMTYTHPHLFHKHMIEPSGLVYKFFEDLKNWTYREDVIALNNYSGVNLYVLGFNSPEQFEKLVESYLEHPGFIRETKNFLIDNSTDESCEEKYIELCKKYNFERIKKNNIGICGGRQFVAQHFEDTDARYCIFLEDDMNLCPKKVSFCKNGFNQYITNLFYKIIKIMDKEGYDFLKLSFTEFFGDNKTQFSWYNVPGQIREQHWPDKPKLPVHGLDPNAPKTVFKNIGCVDGLTYIDGEVYYCNWPQIVSRAGNKRMFLSTKWEHPFEQTWMSYMYQLTKRDMLKSAVLLASPINHERFAFYKSEERREN
jgi:hypothetical protein